MTCQIGAPRACAVLDGWRQASHGNDRLLDACFRVFTRAHCAKKKIFNSFHLFQPFEKYTFSPAELSSERGEKEVLADSKQPTAPPSSKSHVSYCAARVAEERKWRPKVHQARRDDRFSSRFLSLLLTAAIVPTRPTPLLLCSPLPLSLSLSSRPTRFDAFKDVIVLIVHNMLPILGEQPRHLGYRPSLCGFSL